MNIVSGYRLIRDGYSFKSENNGCSIYMSDMFYGHAPLVNGLFLMNLERNITHVHSVDAKRFKVDNDKSHILVALPPWSHWCQAHEEAPC